MSDADPWEGVPEGRGHPEGMPGVIPNVLRQFFGDSQYEINAKNQQEHHDIHMEQERLAMERAAEDRAIDQARFERFTKLEEQKWAVALTCAIVLTFAVAWLIIAWAISL